MTRSELVSILAKQYSSLPHEVMAKIVDIILSEMADELAEGGRVEIRGFGAFSLRKREQRMARNPKTNKVTMVPERHAIYFRCGKDFHENLNK